MRVASASAGGGVSAPMVTSEVAVQPLPSVTVTVYRPRSPAVLLGMTGDEPDRLAPEGVVHSQSGPVWAVSSSSMS